MMRGRKLPLNWLCTCNVPSDSDQTDTSLFDRLAETGEKIEKIAGGVGALYLLFRAAFELVKALLGLP